MKWSSCASESQRHYTAWIHYSHPLERSLEAENRFRCGHHFFPLLQLLLDESLVLLRTGCSHLVQGPPNLFCSPHQVHIFCTSRRCHGDTDSLQVMGRWSKRCRKVDCLLFPKKKAKEGGCVIKLSCFLLLSNAPTFDLLTLQGQKKRWQI